MCQAIFWAYGCKGEQDSQEVGSEVPKRAFLKGWDAEGFKGELRTFQNFTLNNLELFIQVICVSMSFQAF